MAFSGSQTTRLGMYGGARGLYGSFAGKVAVTATSTVGFTMRANRPEFRMPANRPEYTMDDNRAEFTMRKT